MAKSIANDPRAIVRPSVAFDHFTMQQWAPDPPLDRFVTRFCKTACEGLHGRAVEEKLA